MATLEKSYEAKDEIFDLLREQGYPTYARLFNLFDVYITDDPGIVAYMIPKKAVIVLNKLLNKKQVSTIVRHEILHEYLTHQEREEEFHKNNPSYTRNSEISNIAADYEISNRGYTKADKSIARTIQLGDRTLRGLVTEDNYPGWENMTFEEMYEELLKKKEKNKDSLKDLLNQLSQFDPQNLDDLLDQIDKIQQQEGEQGQEGPKQTGSSEKPSNQKGEEEGEGSPSQESGEGEGDSKLGKLKKEIDQEADELEKEIKNAQAQLPPKDDSKDGQEHDVFKTPEEQKAIERVAARAQKIEDAFGDLEMKQRIFDQAAAAIHKEKQRSAQIQDNQLKADPLNQFKLNLRKFIQKETSTKKVRDYKFFNPLNHRLGSDFILRGKGKDPSKYVPQVNVYWDVSYSFSNPAKTAAAESAIKSIHQYAKRGEIKLNVFYHGDNVSAIKSEVENTGNNGNNLVAHINRTKPDNVIIITDGDLSWTTNRAEVPGAVWMLFYGSRSKGLIDNVNGKKDKQIYDIKWNGSDY